MLDQCYEEKMKKEGTFMARKVRHSGTPSSTEPPANAPNWTIDPEWKTIEHGVLLYVYICIEILLWHVLRLCVCNGYSFSTL